MCTRDCVPRDRHLLHHDIDQLRGDEHDLDDLLARDGGLHPFLSAARLFAVLRCPSREGRAPARAACRSPAPAPRSLLRAPGPHRRAARDGAGSNRSLPISLPQLRREIRSERREQQNQRRQKGGQQFSGSVGRHLRQLRLGGGDLVDQLHDGRDRGVEVPAAGEILRDLADGLVQLAQKLLRQGRCWARRVSPAGRALARA